MWIDVTRGEVHYKDRMLAITRSGTLGMRGTTRSPNMVQYVVSVFASFRRAGFFHVKELGIDELEHILAHAFADRRSVIHGSRIPIAADFGNIHEPHQHGKP